MVNTITGKGPGLRLEPDPCGLTFFRWLLPARYFQPREPSFLGSSDIR